MKEPKQPQEEPEHLAVPCPFCAAPAGDSCRRRGDRLGLPIFVDLGFMVYRTVHKRRIHAAAEEVEIAAARAAADRDAARLADRARRCAAEAAAAVREVQR